MKKTLTFGSLLVVVLNMFAQPGMHCDDGDQNSLYIAYNPGDGITVYRIDSIDTNPTDTFILFKTPDNSYGISINKNINNSSGQTTMYCVSNSNYFYYYSDTGWVNTGHGQPNSSGVNLGGNSKYLYTLYHNNLYRYDGTGNATLFKNLPGSVRYLADIAVDGDDNIYLAQLDDSLIYSFTAEGTPVDTYAINTTWIQAAGFAMLNGRFYVSASGGIYEGIITGKQVNFNLKKALPFLGIDLASCPGSAGFPVGLGTVPKAAQFTMYPNPATDAVTILPGNAITVAIYNSLGQQLLTVPVNSSNQLQLPLYNFVPGIYHVIATGNNGVSRNERLVVR